MKRIIFPPARIFPLPLLLLFAAAPAGAETILYHFSDLNLPLEDGTGNGVADTREVSTSITSIQVVTVTLNVAGGWNGDLYAYLRHGSGLSVLLNRPGRTAAQSAGSATSGLDITFSDAAAADVHTAMPSASPGPVTGSFQPDARLLDPSLSLDTSPRSAFLSVFEGMDANGSWTLYVEDTAAGETAVLNSWSLNVTGVPEPSAAALLAAGALRLLIPPRRRNRAASGFADC